MKDQDYIYHVSRGGHRGSYADLLSAELDLQDLTQRPTIALFFALFRARRLFFGMIDETIFFFSAVALSRALFGKKTAGFFFTPAKCFKAGAKGKVNFLIYSTLKKQKKIAIISIQPTPLRPQYSRVTDDWVHDPQLWDYNDKDVVKDVDFEKIIRDGAGGRAILSFIGSGTQIKGLTYLAQMIAAHPEICDKIAVVIAGKISPTCQASVDKLSGTDVLILNRYISDTEIETLYALSDAIWCCYEPQYDQASGIFGRAIQFGKCAIVRDGSMISDYGQYCSNKIIPIPYDNLESAYKKCLEIDAHPHDIINEGKDWKVEAMRKVEHNL